MQALPAAGAKAALLRRRHHRYTAGRMAHSAAIVEAGARPPAGRPWPAAILLVAIIVAHGALTLQLFGPTSRWQKLLDDDPVTSGRHALNLEQSAGWTRGGAFDPSRYAGYPRTAAFDAESRPAAWFRFTARRRFAARAYKIGVALTCLLAPPTFWVAAALMRMNRTAIVFCTALAVVVAWLPPAREFIENGSLCLPAIAMLGVLWLALSASWHERPSFPGWCGLCGTTALGWAIQPAWWSGAVGLGLVGWAYSARRHGFRWHFALGVANLAALAISIPAWSDWLRDWWVRLPVRRPFPDVPLQEFTALGLWLAVLPAAWALSRAVRGFAVRPYAGLVVGSALFLVSAGLLVRPPPAWDATIWGPKPLEIGLSPAAAQLEAVVRSAAPVDARILWEELPGRRDVGWTVLLPDRLARPFVGGLDADGVLEHAACGLRGGNLAGRLVSGWSDAELDSYARRYNIGCVVCASPVANERFARWRAAEPAPSARGDWQVYVVHRPHSFVLKGQAQKFEADSRHVTLCDVAPDDGEVVLSLHYQAGWHARPPWVQVERELDPYDPIPFVRLRMLEPVGRVTITWDR